MSARSKLYYWVGAVNSSSFSLRISANQGDIISIVAGEYWDGSKALTLPSPLIKMQEKKFVTVELPMGIAARTFSNLTTNSVYTVLKNDQPVGLARTFPPESVQLQTVRFGFGSCARYGQYGTAFDHLLQRNITFMLHLGDLDYMDSTENSELVFLSSRTKAITYPSQSKFWSKLPVIYMWDDHDYGTNDANSASANRPTALETYRELVPHYPLHSDVVTNFTALGGYGKANSSEGCVYQAFTYARIRFLLTDLRACHTPGNILGAEQEAWFMSELDSANTTNYTAVVWVTTFAYNSVNQGEWDDARDQRQRIANRIKSNPGLRNFVALSGDAHMLAADDGSHNDFASGGGGGFPILHAGPLANWGSSKGGEMSQGCFAYELMRTTSYGVVEINAYPNGTTCLSFSGQYTEDGFDAPPRVSLSMCSNSNGGWVRTGSAGGNGISCKLEYLPSWLWAVSTVCLVVLICALVTGSWWMRRRIIAKRRKQAAESSEQKKSTGTKTLVSKSQEQKSGSVGSPSREPIASSERKESDTSTDDSSDSVGNPSSSSTRPLQV